MPPKITFPESAIAKMRLRRESGESFEAIAASYGVSHRSVRNALGFERGSGRLDRCTQKREFVKHPVRIDVNQHAWLANEADRLGTTMGVLIEIALDRMIQHTKVPGRELTRVAIVSHLNYGKVTS